eukprot:12517500-Ditylum_brightwellii.AAC.1
MTIDLLEPLPVKAKRETAKGKEDAEDKDSTNLSTKGNTTEKRVVIDKCLVASLRRADPKNSTPRGSEKL